MKKFLLLTLAFIIMFGTANYAAVSTFVDNSNQTITVKPTKSLWNKAKTAVTKKITEVKKIAKVLKTNYGGLRTSILLMAVGVIFIMLGYALKINLVYVVGAIFFIIGALFLLLYLI